MQSWRGVLGLLDTPTKDGRFLLRPRSLNGRELPRPLQLPGPIYHTQVGVITDLSIMGHQLIGAGDIDLRLLDLLNTPMAEALAAGRPIGVALDIDIPAMHATTQGSASALADRHDISEWSVLGAHLNDHPAWADAQITIAV